jgi:hypothetical protein
MKTETIRLLIVFFILLPSLASFLIPAGQPHYRLHERIQAMEAYTLNPSPTTEAARDDEFARLHHHEKMTSIVVPLSALALGIVVVYFFWNYGTRKTLA